MAKVLTETVAGIIPFPAGMVMAFAGSTPPPGWLPCDGSLLSRTTYAVLFAVIGTGWGSGDGSTTFHLPDLRGRFLRGVDGAAGRDPNSGTRTAANAGGNTGNSVGSVQANATAVNGLANAPSALTATAAAQLWTYGLASGTATAIDLAHTHSTPALTLGVTQSVTSGDIPHAHAAGTLSVGTGITGSVANTDLAHTHSTPALTLGVTQSVTSGDIPHLHAAGTLSVGTGITGSVANTDLAHTHSTPALTLGVTQSVTSGDIPHLHAAGSLSVGTGITGSVADTDLTHTHGVGALVNAPSLVTGVTGANSNSAVSNNFPIGVTQTGNNNALWHNNAGTLAAGDGSNNATYNILGANFVATSQTWTYTASSGSAAAQTISGSTAVSAPSGLGVAVIHNHGFGTLVLSSGTVANSTANNTGSIAHTHDINHTHPANNTGAASVSLSHTHPVTGVTGTNATSAVSGTAAAQALSGDAETRPLNANVNYIIKT